MSEGNSNGPVVMRKVIETLDLGKSARQRKSRFPQPGTPSAAPQASQQAANSQQASRPKTS